MIRSRVQEDSDCEPLESIALKVSDGMSHFDFPMMDSLRNKGELAIRVVASVYEGEEAEVLGHSRSN